MGNPTCCLSDTVNNMHGCWCPGDLRGQGIIGHGIDQLSRNIPTLASEHTCKTNTGRQIAYYWMCIILDALVFIGTKLSVLNCADYKIVLFAR